MIYIIIREWDRDEEGIGVTCKYDLGKMGKGESAEELVL